MLHIFTLSGYAHYFHWVVAEATIRQLRVIFLY